jgi:two-component system cell cycle sensor histidine kinase/response regulator CckA
MPVRPDAPPALLVVDDEEMVTRLVARFFRHLGYTVLTAASGEEALAIVRARRPPIDLVLSDVVMPGMSGTELARWLLAEYPTPAVVLMTGQLPDELERVRIEGHIVPVWHKPLDLDRMEVTLRQMLPALPPADDPELRDTR